MRKKALILLLSTVIMCTAIAGCGGQNEEEEEFVLATPTEIEEEEPEEEIEEEEEEEEYREGMYRSELTNEWIDEELENQRPIAVMVDNEKTALLHYGMTQADIVYEMMNSTENGEITRFMAIVKDWDSITQFGSIRSARTTNFMIAPEYDAVLVHDGGPFYIDDYLTNDWVDHLSGGFARINNGKASEFTEYITTGQIESRMESAGYSTEYTDYYQGSHWTFSKDSAPVNLADSDNSTDCTVIELPFPHNSSKLKYDEESNTYLYSEYGMAHTDPANDDRQLAFTTVILQSAGITELDENGYMQFNIQNAKGDGYYITGGSAVPITWSKGNDLSPTKFYYEDGNEIVLNTGKIYIALVSNERWDELVLE